MNPSLGNEIQEAMNKCEDIQSKHAEIVNAFIAAMPETMVNELDEAIKIFKHEHHDHSAIEKLKHEISLYGPHPNTITVHPVFMDELIKEKPKEIVQTEPMLVGNSYKHYSKGLGHRLIPIYVSYDNLKHDQILIQ
jgi:hypothetical protein